MRAARVLAGGGLPVKKGRKGRDDGSRGQRWLHIRERGGGAKGVSLRWGERGRRGNLKGTEGLSTPAAWGQREEAETD